MPQAVKIPAAKAAVDKEWEKLENISAWNLTKVKSTMRPEINSNDFGGFWNQLADSNSNFVVAKIFFLEGFEFLVCSCECAVAFLCPRNSISNVVVSLTVHDNIYTYMCKMYIYM